MTQDDIIEMAREAGASMLHGGDFAVFGVAKLEAFANLVAAAEREACAKLADEYIEGCEGTNFGVGKAIRARGNT